MTDAPAPDDFLLFPEVTHPQGRDQLFLDSWRAMVRVIVETTGRPPAAYTPDEAEVILLTCEADLERIPTAGGDVSKPFTESNPYNMSGPARTTRPRAPEGPFPAP